MQVSWQLFCYARGVCGNTGGRGTEEKGVTAGLSVDMAIGPEKIPAIYAGILAGI